MPRPSKKRKAVWEDMMKRSIFEATVKVMKEHGPAEIRMDQVAKAAEMATGTLYNYFKDKEALLLHVVETLVDPYNEKLQNIVAEDMSPPDKLEAYFHLTCRLFNEQRDVISILLQAKNLGLKPHIGHGSEADIRMTIVRMIAEIVKEGIATGDFRKCDTVEVASMIFGAMDGFIEAKIAGHVPERALEQDVESCMALIQIGRAHV